MQSLQDRVARFKVRVGLLKWKEAKDALMLETHVLSDKLVKDSEYDSTLERLVDAERAVGDVVVLMAAMAADGGVDLGSAVERVLGGLEEKFG